MRINRTQDARDTHAACARHVRENHVICMQRDAASTHGQFACNMHVVKHATLAHGYLHPRLCSLDGHGQRSVGNTSQAARHQPIGHRHGHQLGERRGTLALAGSAASSHSRRPPGLRRRLPPLVSKSCRIESVGAWPQRRASVGTSRRRSSIRQMPTEQAT